jgi:hypothetical protein
MSLGEVFAAILGMFKPSPKRYNGTNGNGY